MRRALLSVGLFLVLVAGPAVAQNRQVPYWATLRAAEVNMRVGPSEAFRIEWVYRRAGLPVKVVRINQGWRLVEDPAGDRGWVVARLLSPERGAIVVGEDLADMRSEGQGGGRVQWRVEPGVVGELGDCEDGWCRFVTGGHKGWMRSERLWGAGEP